MKLKVNEIFRSIQGEGLSLGLPSVFLRLAICNLKCVWCDTDYTWNFDLHKMEDEVHEREIADIAKEVLALGAPNVVVTGGEPMLQQKAMLELFPLLRAGGVRWIEVETNGTMALVDDFTAAIDRINCSPKLKTSGNDVRLSHRPEILKTYQATGKANFKFVVTGPSDEKEILDVQNECGLADVVVMPEGKTKEAQERNTPAVMEMALKNGWRFSPRLHVLVWGDKRGV